MLAAEEEPNPLLPHLSEIIVGAVAFGLLLWFLQSKVFPVFEKTFAERRDAIEGGMERAKEAEEEAKETLAQYREQLADARHEAARLREDAREQGAAIIAEMREQAQAEARRLTEQAHQQIEADRVQAVNSLRAQVGTLATDLAGRIVGESLEDDARQRRVVDRFLDELEARADEQARTATSATPAPWSRRTDTVTSAGMQGASRESLKAARETLGALISSERQRPARGSATTCSRVTALLDREHPLRRALTDPARDGDARVGLARAVLGEQVGGATADLLAWVVAGPLVRAARPRDGARAARGGGAGRRGRAGRPPRRRRGRAVPLQPRAWPARPSCARALSDLSAPVESRAALIEGLLGGRTVRGDPAPGAPGRGRAARAHLRPHGRRSTARWPPTGAAAWSRPSPPSTRSPRSSAAGWPRRCSGSTVTRCTSTSSSTPTSSAASGSSIGDEVIDGSVVSRLDDARRRLAG